VQLLLKPERRESSLTPHPAPLITEGRYLMGRRLLLVVPMLVAVLVISGVALALSACGGGGGSGGGEHQQAKARPLPDKEYKALPPGEYHSEEFKPAFSFRVGKGWQTPDADIKETPERLIIESTEEVKGGTLLIFRNPPEAYDPQKHKWVNVNSYEDILSWFQHHPYLKSSNPEPVTVGGVKGVQLETVVAKDSPVDGVKSFRYSDGFSTTINRGEEGRTIILDMKGEAVSIGVGFPGAQKVVDTVKWGGS
jgi:hypothetical protein